MEQSDWGCQLLSTKLYNQAEAVISKRKTLKINPIFCNEKTWFAFLALHPLFVVALSCLILLLKSKLTAFYQKII